MHVLRGHFIRNSGHRRSAHTLKAPLRLHICRLFGAQSGFRLSTWLELVPFVGYGLIVIVLIVGGVSG